MAILKKIYEIEIRIADIENQLKLIEEAMAAEMRRPFFKRRIGICRFLDMERKVYAGKLNELKWLIYE
jgi:hypothetical protein